MTIIALAVVVSNLVVDLLYSVLNPGFAMAVELRELAPAPSGLPETKDPLSGRFSTLRTNIDIWGPASILGVIALMCFVYPEIYHLRSSTNGSLGSFLVPPLSKHYLLGTDPLGVDIVSRLLYGGRVPLEVGFGATVVGMVIGGVIGMTSGYVGGAVDSVIMRALDILLAFPALILRSVMSNYLGPSELHVIYAIAIVSIPAFARPSRAETIRLRDQTFVVAAKLSGSRDLRIVVRHIAPNVLQRLITYGFLFVAVAVIVEAAVVSSDSACRTRSRAGAKCFTRRAVSGNRSLARTPSECLPLFDRHLLELLLGDACLQHVLCQERQCRAEGSLLPAGSRIRGVETRHDFSGPGYGKLEPKMAHQLSETVQGLIAQPRERVESGSKRRNSHVSNR